MNTGIKVVSESAVYKYVNIDETFLTENFSGLKISAPRCDSSSRYDSESDYCSSEVDYSSSEDDPGEYYCGNDDINKSSEVSQGAISCESTCYEYSHASSEYSRDYDHYKEELSDYGNEYSADDEDLEDDDPVYEEDDLSDYY